MEHDFIKDSVPGTGPAPVYNPDDHREGPIRVQTSPAAGMDPVAVRVGKWDIPPMTIATAQLLERIESPFILPTLDPETGKPIPFVPRITDITRALYIILNQNDPRLITIISDKDMLDRAVLEMSRGINFREMAAISKAIQGSMSAVSEASEAAGLEGVMEKKEDAGKTLSN